MDYLYRLNNIPEIHIFRVHPSISRNPTHENSKHNLCLEVRIPLLTGSYVAHFGFFLMVFWERIMAYHSKNELHM